jgi:hypothetical protein
MDKTPERKNMNTNRANEKLLRAVDALVTGVGTIQQRLAEGSFHYCLLVPEDLPEDMREEYSDLTADLTGIHGPDGSLKATILSMSDEESNRCASRIIRMYGEIRNRGGIESGKRITGDGVPPEETIWEN